MAVDDTLFRVAVPNGFAKDWLESRYRSLISQTLARVVGYCVTRRVRGARGRTLRAERRWRRASRETAETGGGVAAPRHRRSGPASAWNPAVSADPRVARVSLNPRYTFRTFIVGSANRLAHAASLSVAERPGHAYNPLFLYGGVGLGKTHLMHAIGNAVRGALPAQARRLRHQREVHQRVHHLRSSRARVDDFRARYRRIDLLLIDDIQFIADKERTQEEFFHTFNAIHEDGKQIVLSSDRPPKPITTLEERLRSRFEWGLIADLTAPDLETRIAILRAKAEEQCGPHQLRGARVHRPQGRLQHPGARGRAQPHRGLREHAGHAHHADLAQAVLSNVLYNPSKRAVTPERIAQAVSEYYGVDMEALKGQKRDRAIVVPRQIAMYLMRAETEVSLLRIGAELGGRDHSTVLHACDKIDREMQENEDLRRELAAVRELDLHRVSASGIRGRSNGSRSTSRSISATAAASRDRAFGWTSPTSGISDAEVAALLVRELRPARWSGESGSPPAPT